MEKPSNGLSRLAKQQEIHRHLNQHIHEQDIVQEFMEASSSRQKQIMPLNQSLQPMLPSWQDEFQQYQYVPDTDFRVMDQVYQAPVNMIQEFQRFENHPLDNATEEEWNSKFAAIEQKLKNTNLDQSWTDEFQQQPFEENYSDKEWNEKFNQAWNESKQQTEEFIEWDKDFGHLFPSYDQQEEYLNNDPLDQELDSYNFEAVNPFMSHPDPMAEGLRILKEQGSLSDAALAFEAAIQKDPTNFEAWHHLGQTQVENEKELAAISALQHCVKLNPEDQDALMLLAVSFVNEGLEAKAFAILDRWIHLIVPNLGEKEKYQNLDTFRERLVEKYIDVASSQETLNANVQVGLGLLFYVAHDFEKAVDCFSSALSVRPDDYLLWNRLGATLANSGESEKAIDAYYKALSLKPSFVRARFNLGVSCINVGCYKEAAEHFLGALSLHVPKDGSMQANVSENLWSTLRRTFIMMQRQDLADLANEKQDLNIFKPEFEF